MSCRVLAVGEVVWDIIRGEEHIGGAPFNVAAHVARLGGEARILTRVGVDARGRRALAEMHRLGVDPTWVQTDPDRPTGWARVDVGPDGVPAFHLPENPAYLHIEMNGAVLRQLSSTRLDAIAIGTLPQRGGVTHRSLMELLEQVPVRHVLYDVNIRMDYYPEEIMRRSLHFSTIVKVNEEELHRVSRRLYGTMLPAPELAQALAREFPVRVLCVTNGAAGCSVHADGESRSFPAEPARVVDTIGAGDAFCAAFLAHYARTSDPFAAAQRGSVLAAYVATRRGAVPEYDERIRQLLSC